MRPAGIAPPRTAPPTAVSPVAGVARSGGHARLPAAVAALLDPGADRASFRAARALDESADRYLDAHRPVNTRKAYAADWASWQAYTRWAGIPMLSGGRGALVGFVLWLEHGGPTDPGCTGRWPGHAPATINRRVTGALHQLRRRHVPLDPDGPAAATAALHTYRRRLAEANHRPGRGKAHPVTVADLLALSRACPPDLAGLRDRAALVIGFYLAARASDLAWLMAGDVTAERNGLVITVRVGKTTGESALPARKHPLLCPREAWLRWREAAHLNDGPDLTDGPALRPVRGPRPGPRALSPDAVTRLITRAGARAQLPHPVTGHSLRAGFATAAYRAGWDPLRIARHGRWTDNSPELLGYIHDVERWNQPSDGLDLEPEL